MNDNPKIEIGDRYETKDSRDAGRVVEVIEVRGLSSQGRRLIELASAQNRTITAWGEPIEDHLEYLRKSYTFYVIRSETNPKNPSAVGRKSTVHEGTLATKYKKVSR